VADLRVDRLARDQLEQVASLHARAFPDSAINALGLEAVRRYYQWLLEGPHDAALVGAWSGGRLVGFCAAGVFRGAMNGFLRTNRWYLARRIATHPSLLASPLVRDRLKQAVAITVRFSGLARRVTAAPPARPRFGVLAIATDPAVRGAGAGRALMLEAEARAVAAGHDRMVLTVHPENTRAVRFYEQLGWQPDSPAGAGWTGAMIKDLSRPNSR
jgi:ribosomal protein S18 acetylase RimI-like enzyme